jgi:hypothetical protein
MAVDPKLAEARALEEKLQYCARQGAFLVISVEAQFIRAAQDELNLDHQSASGGRPQSITTDMADTR